MYRPPEAEGATIASVLGMLAATILFAAMLAELLS